MTETDGDLVLRSAGPVRAAPNRQGIPARWSARFAAPSCTTSFGANSTAGRRAASAPAITTSGWKRSSSARSAQSPSAEASPSRLSHGVEGKRHAALPQAPLRHIYAPRLEKIA